MGSIRPRPNAWRTTPDSASRPSSPMASTQPLHTKLLCCGCSGSVSTRASKYCLSWDEANPGSRGLQDGQHGRGPPEVEESLAVGGNMLVMAGAEAEKVAQFIVGPAEPSG